MTDPATAAVISTTSELLRAVLREGLDRTELISTSRSAIDYLAFQTGYRLTEQFRVLYLDGASRLIADEVAYEGDLAECPAYPRPIVSRAIDLGADGIIVAHNHPAGDPKPSRSDLHATHRLSRACDAIGIRLLDHLIFSGSDWCSFREQGLL